MTNLRKLILMALLALPLSLAVGCGDDDSNGNGDGDGNGDGNGGGGTKVDPTSHCTGGAEAWKLTALDVQSEYGFDLDGHVTGPNDPATPATGCGIPDGNDEGIDNGFGELLAILPSIAGDLDINEVIAEALADGSVSVMAYIRGYEEGGANDNIELTLLVNQVEYPELVDVKAEYDAENGKIVATLDKLPLSLSGIEVNIGDSPAELNLTITILNVRVEIEEPAGDVASTVTMLGGAVQYYGDGGLSADLADLIAQMDLDLGDIDIDDIVGGLLDISSNGTDCDSLSIGAQVTFTYSDLCEG